MAATPATIQNGQVAAFIRFRLEPEKTERSFEQVSWPTAADQFIAAIGGEEHH
jgi:hypothetical protein